MSKTVPSLQEALENSKEAFFDVSRFCLSDQVIRPMDCVTRGQATLVGYTGYIHDNHSEHFFNTFGYAYLPLTSNLPQALKDAWVYDRILEAVTFYRISAVRPKNIGDVSALVATALPYALTINDEHCEASSYAGLTVFKVNSSVFVDAYGLQCDLATVGITKRLISAVGDMEDTNWFLYSPVWQKALIDQPDRLRSLRGFLHIVIIAVVSMEETIINNFDVTREALLVNIEEFIELVESSETTVSDIIRFVESVEYYSFDIGKHNLLGPLFDLPFHVFAERHLRVFGYRYLPLEELSMHMDVQDKPEWAILRKLGEEFSPEIVINTPTTPYAFVDKLINQELPNIYPEIVATLNEHRATSLPTALPKSRAWVDNAIADRIYCSLIERRMMHMEPESKEVIPQVVKNMSHILLVLEDRENERYGLSLVGELLHHHIQDNLNKLSERELETLALLLWAWDQLAITKPQRMEKAWKSVLKNSEVRHKLRSLMFTILETINIPDDPEFTSFLDVERQQFFTYVENFCEYLAGTPTEEEIAEFLETMPMLSKTIVLNQWDQCLWSQSFNTIPPVG